MTGPGRVLVVVLAALGGPAVPDACAQLLRLDRAAAPPARTGEAARALSSRLTAERAEHRLTRDTEGITDEVLIRASAAMAVRTIAIDLLGTGERLGPPGSVHVVHALTLVRAIPDLEALAARSLEHAKAVAALRLEPVPEAPGELDDALRAAFAEVAAMFVAADESRGPAARAEGVHAGWIVWAGAGALGEQVRAIEAGAPSDAIEAPARSALAGLRDAIESDGAWGRRTPMVRACAGVIASAPALRPVPAWVPEDARARLRTRWNGAVAQLAADPGSDTRAARAELLRLARLRRVVELADGRGAGAWEPREVRDEAVAWLRAAPDEPGTDARLAGAIGALELLAGRALLPTERETPRELRPAWRAMERTARATQAPVLAALPALRTRADAATDPGVVSALAAHRGALDGLGDLRRLGVWIAPGGDPDPARRAAAQSLLRLGQAAARSEPDPQAVITLRAIAEVYALTQETAADRELAACLLDPARSPVLDALAGGRAPELLRAARDAAGAWMAACGDAAHGPTGALTATLAGRVRTARAVRDALADGVVAAEMLAALRASGGAPGARAALQAWPGWECSASTLEHLLGDAPARLPEMVGLVCDGDWAGADRLLARAWTARTPARLVAALEREARARALVSPGPVPELAAGATEPADWLGAERGPIAEFCRYALESAGSRAGQARDRAGAYAAQVAADILARRP